MADHTTPQPREEIVAWVGGQVLPHEADVRAWLRRSGVTAGEVDDIVQEAYCRLAALESVRHIANGRAYFFQTARSLVLSQIRRARVVRMDAVADMDSLSLVDQEPSPERIAVARNDLERIRRLIEGLPDRCRTIFELRRIQGVPQKEIARRMGLNEKIIEVQASRGLKLILKALEGEDADAQPQRVKGGDHDASKRPRRR